VNQNIQREAREDGIAILTFDRPNSAANIFDEATFDELNQHIDALEADKSVKGLVIRSAKPKIFIAGADLNAFTRDLSPEKIAELIDQGQKTFDRLDRLQFPTVAAIHGVALGGGFELALACDYRVASIDPATKLGLPETTLGILPAWGGSTRLPRLVGLPAALDAILTGRQYPAKQALKLGIVDAVAYPERILGLAFNLIQKPVPRKTSFKVQTTNRAPFSRLIASQAQKKTLAKTHGNYPAPLKALEVVLAGLTTSHAQSLTNEKTAFVELARGAAAQNLIRVFFLQERAKKLSVACDQPLKKISKVLVIGAGTMGAGIAQWLAARGLRVVLRDVNPEALGRGMQTVAKLFRDAVSRRLLNEAEGRSGYDRVLPVYEEIPLRDVDLVIEAAVEQLDLKKKIFAELDSKISAGILATNTSAISIDAIANGLARPERVVGIHFFNPVHRMQLVEVVVGPKTSPLAQATAVQFVKGIGKLPVLVKDSPGFLVNRILLPYMVEAVRLFAEGHSVEKIDRLMVDFGMPMGPLRLIDEVGLDVAQHVAKDLEERVKHLAPMDNTVAQMMARGWLGRKSGKGFYEYGSSGNERRNSQLSEFQKKAAPEADDASLRDRMVLVMVNEAARCLEEGVVSAPEDVDFAMIMGSGWAPFRGGPLRYADSLGIGAVVNRLNVLQAAAGSHLAPCDLLSELAGKNGTFFPPAVRPMNAKTGSGAETPV
jgi:3-hydroxyacyl-CoA dehydrogenase / enoyl-CoA hydratase / 3-hydroxybutyryl-CoA epimerase